MWLPAKKMAREIDLKTIEQKKKAHDAQILSQIQKEIGDDMIARLSFFAEKNHFADKLGKVFRGA